MAKLIKLLLVVMLVGLVGCGQQGGSSSSDSDETTETTTEESIAVSAILLSTTSSTISTGETADISARLLNSSGQLVTESKTVEFTLSAPALASINSPGVTSTGVLSRTLTANNIEGEVTVTASVDSATTTLTIEISDELAAATVNVSSNPSEITVGGTSVISATVLDSNGDPMAAGTNVNFEVNNTALGTVVSSASISGTSGVAQATFSAGTTTAGTATITATSGAISGTTTIDIVSADAGSIEFESADPQIIVIKGSGGVETSVVKFLVKDTNGDPVVGSQTVTMTLSGPNGGEYIGSIEGATTLDVGTVDGYATVVLHSGTIPGTATINAAVEGTSLTTSSGVIAIGGGVPSEGHFTLSTSQFNLEGLKYTNITADITAQIADRYGNYNVLEGTSVSFYAECGAIDRATNLNAEGENYVVFRTQNPAPEDVAPSLEDGETLELEQDIIASYASVFGVTIDDSNNPRDGLCTLIAVVDGEEEFTDTNGDGLYNDGEPYDDTYDDIHLDMDDDSWVIAYGAETAGVPFDPAFEDLVVDRNLDGNFDGMNDVWDSNKRISKPIKLLITGIPSLSAADSSGGPLNGLYIADGSSRTIYFSLHDMNYNPPIAGTSISVSTDVGKLSGTTATDFLDTNQIGAPIFQVVLSDGTAADDKAAETGTLKFTWDYKGSTYSVSYIVTVD